jgi:hypothetical protein
MANRFAAFGDGNGFSVLGQGNSYTALNSVVGFQDISGATSNASGVTPGSGNAIAKPLSLENACKIWWSLTGFQATIQMNDNDFGTDNFNNELPQYATAAGLTRATEDCEDQSAERTETLTVTNPTTLKNVTGSYTFDADLRSPHGNGAANFYFFDDGNFNILGYGFGSLVQIGAGIQKQNVDDITDQGVCSETRFYTNYHVTLDSSEELSDVVINGINLIEVRKVIGPSGSLLSSNPFTISLNNFNFATYS